MKRYAIFVLLMTLGLSIDAQVVSKKKLGACRMSGDIRIDGVLDEPEWEVAQIGTDFIQREPNPGLGANQMSEVRVLYDDEAIYVGALLHDTSPDSILFSPTKDAVNLRSGAR